MLQLCTRLRIHTDPFVWEAVERDEFYMVKILRDMCGDPRGEAAIIALGQNVTYADPFIKFVEMVSSQPF